MGEEGSRSVCHGGPHSCSTIELSARKLDLIHYEQVALHGLLPSRGEEPNQSGQGILPSHCVLGSKLFHPSVIGAGFSGLSHPVAVAFYSARVRSVAELDGFVLLRELDFLRHISLVSVCCIALQ